MDKHIVTTTENFFRRSRKRRRSRQGRKHKRVHWIMELFNETGCLACGTTQGLTVDHIVPKCRGGHLRNPANLMPLCQPCNNFKSHKEPMSWFATDLSKERQTRHLLDRILFAKEVPEQEEENNRV